MNDIIERINRVLATGGDDNGFVSTPFSDRHAGDDPLPIAYQARCLKCGEEFNPSGEELTVIIEGEEYIEHYQRFGPDENGAYETECGGFGVLVGSWR